MTPSLHTLSSIFIPHVNRRRQLLACLLLAIALGLNACGRGKSAALPYLDMKTLSTDPPRSLALLPTTDNSGHPEIAEPMRKALYNALASLPYHDRELAQIDAFLQRMAVRRGLPPGQLTPEMMVDPELADCVLFSNIERVSRLYLFFYSHYRLDLDIIMVDTRSRKVLFHDRFQCYNRNGAPFFSIPGILGSTLFSLWHLRASELEDSLESAARRIARDLPTPPVLATGEKNLVFENAEVTLPNRPLRAGDRIEINVIANSGCEVSYSIGKIIQQALLVEDTPGHYNGAYTVKDDDNASYCLVDLTIRDYHSGESLDHPVAAYPFSIDTARPPRAYVAAAQYLGGDKGLRLDIERLPGDVEANDEIPRVYHIYRRRQDNEPKFQKVASVHEPCWTDPTANTASVYEYLIITEDEAGNLSSRGQVRLIETQIP